MYKDVKKMITWRKVLAIVITICLVVTVVQMPDVTVKAEDGIVYHDYTNSTEGEMSTVDEKTVAAVFTIGQNESAGAEQLETVSFDLHKNIALDAVSGNTAKAAVYLNPSDAVDPTSGTFLCEVASQGVLDEGTNRIQLNATQSALSAGTVVAVLITLDGEDFSFQENASEDTGKTFVQTADGWVDAGTRNQRMNIALKTSDVADDVEAVDTSAPVAETPSEETLDGTETTTDDIDTPTTDEVPVEDATDDSSDGIDLNAAMGIAPMSDDGEDVMPLDTTPGNIADAEVTIVSNAIVSSTNSMTLPTVVVTYNGEILQKDVDYTLFGTSTTGVWNNVGDEATLRVTGVNGSRFNGTEKTGITYKIVKNIADVVEINSAIASKTYTGSSIQLTDAELFARNEITASDYTISYENNVNVGTATVTVTAKTTSNYGGSVSGTFTISPMNISTLPESSFAYDKTTVFNPAASTTEPPTVTVSYGDNTLTPVADYKVTSSGFENAGTGTITLNADAGTNAVKNYTGTKTLPVTINACSLSNSYINVTLDHTEFNYKGTSITPSTITMKYGDTTIYNKGDGLGLFDVTYKDASGGTNTTDYGVITGTITPTASNTNYTGTKTFTYEITKIALDDTNIEVTHKDSMNYDDAVLKQYVNDHDLLAVKLLSGSTGVTFDMANNEVTLKDNVTGHVLVAGTDYEVSYQNNKAVSTDSWRAQATFTGKGNYTDSLSKSFLIAQDISEVTIPSEFPTLPYKGQNKEVTYANGAIVIKNSDDIPLTQGDDYEVAYSNNKVVGTATYTISGKSNVTSKGCYVGTVSKPFTITKKNIVDEDVVVTIPDIDYVDGTTETVFTNPSTQMTVKYGEETLNYGSGREYVIQSYNGNHDCGPATVTLQGVGDNYTGTKTVEFNIRGKEITDYTIDVTNYEYTGGIITPSITVSKGGVTLDPTNYVVKYQQHGENVTPKNVGDYDIIVSGNNSNNYTGTIRGTFSITQRSINDTKIVQDPIPSADCIFTGSQITPTIILRNNISGSTINLVKDTDYTIAWSNNVNAGTDTAKATVTGMGNYTGSREITFSIQQKSMQDADVVIAPVGVQSYTGSAIEPKPVVTLGEYELKENIDFTYEWKYNTEKGTNKAEVWIVAKDGGNFKLRKKATFSIMASLGSYCEVTFTDKVDSSNECFYEGKAIQPGVQVVDLQTHTTLVKGTDYVVTYSDNVNAGTAKVTIRGIGAYTSIKEVPFTIKKVKMEDVEVNLTNSTKTFAYTGNQITPTIKSIKYGTYTFTSNDTYGIAYGTNVNVAEGGVMTITSTGNNFEGTKTVDFTIAPKDISKSGTAFANDMILLENGTATSAIATQSYTGSTIEPAVALQYKVSSADIKDLNLNTDYSIGLANNIDPGVATMTFTGMGNYKGTVEQKFTIARDISGATVEGIAEVYPYTGEAITVDDTLRVSLIGSTDEVYTLTSDEYNVAYTANTNAGTATVTITGNEDKFYTGTIPVKNFIIKANFADAVIQPIEDVPRDPAETDTAKRYPPSAISVTCGGNTFNNVASNESYTTECTNDQQIGTATITLTGVGPYYEGTKEATYDIVPENSHFKIVYKNGEKIPDQKFCGKDITFDPESEDFPFEVFYVEEDGTTERTLTYGTDYTLEYDNNKDANVKLVDGSYVDNGAKAEVTVKGIGKYKYNNSNGVPCTFTILPLLLDQLTIDDSTVNPDGVPGTIGPRTYTGKTITPTEIKINDVNPETGDVIYTLTSSDYTLTPVTTIPDGATPDTAEKTYSYQAGPKTACVTIAGNGTNCIGSMTVEYDVAQMDIANTKITTTAQEYTGYQLMPDVHVVNPLNDNAVLVLDSDYFLEYENNIDAGTATVHVVANDTDGHNFKGTTDVTFKINPIQITASSISMEEIPTQDYSGKGVEPDITIYYTDPLGAKNALHKGTDYDLTYANNTKAGTARVTVTGKGNYKGTTAKPFTITPCDIGEGNLNISIDEIPNQAYTGNNLTPPVTVSDGDYQMKSNIDYTVTYSNNKELGMATATVVGKGNYKGERSTTFKIASDISKATIGNGVAREYTYTGAEICPHPSNVRIGTTNLTANVDYTISYEENILAGTGKVILTGKGTYGGTLVQEFTINPKDISESDVKMTGYSENVTYAEADVTLPIGFTYGTMTLEEGTDFAISYSDNFALGTASFEVVGAGNYTGTLTKTFEIVKKSVADADITIADMSSTYTYDGEAIIPEPTLNYGEERLTPEIDYTVEYANNNAVGVATMTITGVGRYQGTRVVNYNILRKSVVNCSISSVGTQVYTGSDIEPSVTVADGDKSMTLGTDYTLMYSNNRKSGSGSVIIAGKGNYTVTKTIRFDIRPGGTTNFMVNSTSNTSVGLSWGAQGVVTGYEIYRADSSGNYTRIARTRGTTYTDMGLTAGTAYAYRVRAYLVADDETYYSSFSDTITGTTNN